MLDEDLLPLGEREHWDYPTVFCVHCLRRYSYQRYFLSICAACGHTALHWCSPNENNKFFFDHILNPALLKYELSIQARDFANRSITFNQFVDNCLALRARLEARPAVP